MRRRSSSVSPLRWLCPLAALLGPRVAQSQFVLGGSFDLGVATVRQPAQPRVTAPTLGGEFHIDGDRLALRAVAGAALADADRWSAQSDLGASWIAASHGRLSWELGLTGSALRYTGASAATTGSLVARQHVEIGRGGLWLGAGGGLLGRAGGSRPIGTVEAGSWLRASRLQASFTIAMQRARLDTAADNRLTGVFIEAPVGTRPLLAVDATALATWRTRRFDLTGTGTIRRAAQQRDGLIGSALATGAWWMVSGTALTATAGSLAADPLRALPARRVAMLGLRFRPSSSARTAAAATRPPSRLPTPAAEAVMRDGHRILRILAPGATAVDVRADCTAWQPTPLVRVGDWWELAVPFEAGTQHLVLRIDGGEWKTPANLPSIEDEFGEKVGLLVVP